MSESPFTPEHQLVTYEFTCACGQSQFYVEGKPGHMKKLVCKGCKTLLLVTLKVEVAPILNVKPC